MNLKQKIRAGIGAGVFTALSFFSCASGPKYFYESNGHLLGVTRYEKDKIILSYDTNNDGKIDKNIIYQLIDMHENGVTQIWEEIGEAHDLNNDGDFNDEGEVIELE